MELTVSTQISKEYGLEIVNCMLNELSNIPSFERLVILEHAHRFLVKECSDETAQLLSTENNKAEYMKLKSRMDALLPIKKEQLINILEMGNISELLEGE